MCGIAGFWGPAIGDRDQAIATVRCMCTAIAHRGPDDADQWIDPEAGVALGFRRLSILDLSPEGRQPMASATGRYRMVFNGEIYNWQDLRREEEAHGARWRGHSDTEVFLAAVERRGLGGALEASIGMFGLALWDRAERRLSLVRDRIGEKPLYYGWLGYDPGVRFGAQGAPRPSRLGRQHQPAAPGALSPTQLRAGSLQHL